MSGKKVDNRNRGFTLVELMIVVAIIGILAAVAIPAFSHFIEQSKDAEAAEKVKAIADSAVMYYNTPQIHNNDPFQKTLYRYPGTGGSSIYVPRSSIGAGQRVSIPAADYSQAGWRFLSVDLGATVTFRYSYRGFNETTVGGDPVATSFGVLASMPLTSDNARNWYLVGCPNGSVANPMMQESESDDAETSMIQRQNSLCSSIAPEEKPE